MPINGTTSAGWSEPSGKISHPFQPRRVILPSASCSRSGSRRYVLSEPGAPSPKGIALVKSRSVSLNLVLPDGWEWERATSSVCSGHASVSLSILMPWPLKITHTAVIPSIVSTKRLDSSQPLLSVPDCDGSGPFAVTWRDLGSQQILPPNSRPVEWLCRTRPPELPSAGKLALSSWDFLAASNDISLIFMLTAVRSQSHGYDPVSWRPNRSINDIGRLRTNPYKFNPPSSPMGSLLSHLPSSGER